MGRLIEVAFLIFIVAGTLYLIFWVARGARSSAAGAARRRAGARWVVDDTGTNDHGQAVMAIELRDDDDVAHGRHEVGAYDPVDNLAWTELRGQAEASARELNERIEQAQDRRR